MKYSIYVSQYTQKLQTLAYIEKKSINLKKDTKEYLQSSLKQKKKKIYIPFNSPRSTKCFNKKSNFFRKLVKIMMLD